MTFAKFIEFSDKKVVAVIRIFELATAFVADQHLMTQLPS